MLLRTVLLLLLCVSAGMCATLGHYQAEEEEVPALTNGVEASDVGAAQVGDSGPDEEPAASSDDSLLAKLFGGDNPAADEPEVDVPLKDGERPAGHAAAAAAVKDLADEAVTQEQPISPASSDDEDRNDIQPVQKNQTLNKPLLHEDENSWSINSIRSGFQSMHGYFDSLVELVGGHNGVCQYRCRYGEPPQPRPGYQPSEPDGCRSSLVGFQVNAAFDLGIPAMTRCCNELDMCYESCGSNKYDCDSKFRTCLHGICSDLNKSLGFVSKVQGCESMADTLYNTVWTLGCRPYMNSQRAACVCEGEERDEL